MENRKKALVPVLILWMISIGNVFRLTDAATIRPVLFLSIFALGALTGVLIYQVVSTLRKNG